MTESGQDLQEQFAVATLGGCDHPGQEQVKAVGGGDASEGRSGLIQLAGGDCFSCVVIVISAGLRGCAAHDRG